MKVGHHLSLCMGLNWVCCESPLGSLQVDLILDRSKENTNIIHNANLYIKYALCLYIFLPKKYSGHFSKELCLLMVETLRPLLGEPNAMA